MVQCEDRKWLWGVCVLICFWGRERLTSGLFCHLLVLPASLLCLCSSSTLPRESLARPTPEVWLPFVPLHQNGHLRPRWPLCICKRGQKRKRNKTIEQKAKNRAERKQENKQSIDNSIVFSAIKPEKPDYFKKEKEKKNAYWNTQETIKNRKVISDLFLVFRFIVFSFCSTV